MQGKVPRIGGLFKPKIWWIMRGESRLGRIQAVHVDLVQAGVRGKQETVVRRHHYRVAVDLLRGRRRRARPRTFMLVKRRRFSKLAVPANRKCGRAARGPVGYNRHSPGRVGRNVTGLPTSRWHTVDEGQLARVRVNGKGAYLARQHFAVV